MGFKHRSNNDGRFSDAIWADMPEEVMFDPCAGIYACDMFTNFGLTTPVSSNVAYYSGGGVVGGGGSYKSYEDTGGAISQLPTALGRLSISTDNSDNDEVWLQSCGGTGVLGKISSTAKRKMWFEARIAASQIVTQNFFVGLAEEGLAAADTITDAGAMASKDFIGFRVLEDAASAVDIVYRKAGQTEQEVASAAHTLVANTFVNLGFVYDPDFVDRAQRIRFYINGVKQGSYVSASQAAASTFPDGEELAFLIGLKNSTTTANTLLCEGWRFAQMF
jgi:hypothetical protein